MVLCIKFSVLGVCDLFVTDISGNIQTGVCLCLFFSQGGRGNGRGNGAINGPMTVRGNGASGVNRSPLSSVNSLAIQDPTAAEYAPIRKFRKVKYAYQSYSN